jgi:uncharacterized membrane protein
MYPLETAPYWIDEGFTVNAVTAYQNNPPAGIAATLDSGATYECFLYCKTTSYLTEAYGDSPTTFRILSVIFGLLSLLIIYAVTRLSLGSTTALGTFILLTFSYLHIAWSTQARWYTLALTFTWLSILFYLKATDVGLPLRQRLLYSFGLFCSIGLAILTHKILLLLPILFLTHYWYISRASRQQTRIGFLLTLSLSISLFGFLWYLVNRYDLLSSITIQNNLPYYLGFLWNYYWLLIPLAIFSITRQNLRPAHGLLIWIFIGYVGALSFFTDTVHYRYLFMVTPVLFIFATTGALEILATINTKYSKKHGYVFISLLLVLFFISPTGTILPQTQYWLESDPARPFFERPSHLYTPQPNWNAAYAFVATARTSDEIIISSHPVFTKLFLKEPGYWIAYDYLGSSDHTKALTKDGKEFYVGATALQTSADVQSLTNTSHGFIIFDHMAQDGRIPTEILTVIQNNFPLVYYQEDNPHSAIWIYKF